MKIMEMSKKNYTIIRVSGPVPSGSNATVKIFGFFDSNNFKRGIASSLIVGRGEKYSPV